MPFYVRTKIRNIFRFVQIEDGDESLRDFVDKGNNYFIILKWMLKCESVYFVVLAVHGIAANEINPCERFDIMDEHGVLIDSFELIKQYKSCSHFFVEIDISLKRKNVISVAEVICKYALLGYVYVLIFLSLY